MSDPLYQVGQSVRYDPCGEGERVGVIMRVDAEDLFTYEITDPFADRESDCWPVRDDEILGTEAH